MKSKFIKEILNNPGIKSKLCVMIFRLSNLYNTNSLILKFFSFPFFVLNKLINECLFSVEIPYDVKIGCGFKIWHSHCIVINKGCVIGNDFEIRHGCTLGSNKLDYPKRFIIGNNVKLGVHCSILSDDIYIGDNVFVGAGVTLMHSVDENSYVIGAKPIIKSNR